MKKGKVRSAGRISAFFAAVLVSLAVFVVFSVTVGVQVPIQNPVTTKESTVAVTAETETTTNPGPGEEYPEILRELYTKNEEARDFVMSYFELKDKKQVIDLSEYKDSKSMPLFIQWDTRWGYLDYGGDFAAVSACGPVSLAMVGYHFTKNEELFAPDKVMKFAVDNGYRVPEVGTSWSLMTEGAKKLGLESEVIYADEALMAEKVKNGSALIMSMAPGHFTDTGHFIVVHGYKDGKFLINDPDSVIRSNKAWSFSEFSSEIKNIWCLSYNDN